LTDYRSVNALAETVIGLFKAEVVRRQGPWRSPEAVEFATLDWVDWFNHRRLLEPIGFVPPAEAEAAFYAELENLAVAGVIAESARTCTLTAGRLMKDRFGGGFG
jgi:hypothetical protein